MQEACNKSGHCDTGSAVITPGFNLKAKYRIDFKSDDHHVVTVNRDPEQYKCTGIAEDVQQLNNLLNWWIQDSYDYYHEWLDETLINLQKQQEKQQDIRHL